MQLSDFLSTGKYGQEPSEEQRRRLAHCRTTNLFGEANFGDLDLSLYNRCNCTNHHHSSINTLRRNKTVSWYLDQSPNVKKRFLQAILMGKEIRSQSQEKERSIRQETQHVCSLITTSKGRKNLTKLNECRISSRR